MATFTDDKVREALKEALEHDPKDEVDLLEAVMQELGLATIEDHDIDFLLRQIKSMPEASALIRARQAQAGAKAVRQGHESLTQAVNDGS